ncbi:UDP-3-O-(3-hydroxymyristoyl)glucosamine N-acyltransferase [Desulfomarina sp.]
MIEKEVTVEVLAGMAGGRVDGDGSVMIRGFASLDQAGPGDMSFLVKKKDQDLLKTSQGAAFIVPEGVEGDGSRPLVIVRDPYLAAAIVHSYILEDEFQAKGINSRAFVGEDCEISDEITIGPMVVLGDRVTIGKKVTIEAGVVIGNDVTIGDECLIKSNATICDRSILGNRVIIQPGAVIGSDGYGYATDAKGCHVKRPQVGNVRIEDDVEIGANTTIDRATFGTTWIRSGAKIDNLVQVGHNVVVGENSLIVAQVGISGSVTLGRNVVMGGQAGTAGHVKIGDRVMVAARGGVHTDVATGARIGGAPAIPVHQWARASAVFAKLPELRKEVKKLGKAVKKIEQQD